jgi:TatD DNase family protein
MSQPFWVDTHCHLDAAEFDADRDAQRQLARERGVGLCVIPAVEWAHWGRVRELAHRHHDVCALGVHPLYVDRAREADLPAMARDWSQAANDERVVAVGEIGLDGFVGHPDRETQLKWFRLQLAWARDLRLPVILHVRRAVDEVLRELRRCPVVGGIAHAFNGSAQQARAFMDLGFALGFGGALTFERALQLRRLATALPLSALVLETDAPDIPPQWLYKTAEQRALGQPQGINSPAELPRIGESLASLRDMSPNDLARACADNAFRVLSCAPGVTP